MGAHSLAQLFAIRPKARPATAKSAGVHKAARDAWRPCGRDGRLALCHQTQDRMDLDTLKGKTIDDKLLSEIKGLVDAITSERDAADEKARKAARESIEGRKALKAERDKAFEKLGVSSADELDALPDAKGQGEATKQLEAQLKKAVRERDEAVAARDEQSVRVKSMTRERVLGEAIGAHKFKHPADVTALLLPRLVEEGDELRFRTDDGKLVPVKDGAAWFAKTRPDYVQAGGTGGDGSGFKGGAGGSPSGKTTTRNEFDAMNHAQRAEFAKSGGQVVEA